MRFAPSSGRHGRLVALFVFALLLGAGCVPSNPEDPRAGRDRSENKAPSATTSLLFLEGRSLLRMDVASGKRTKLGTFPAPDVRASPGSSWIAYVAPGGPVSETEPDFLADPRLRLYDPASGEALSLGRGFSPLWDPSGTKVAYLSSSPARSCDGETCSGEVSVRLAWPASGKIETIVEGGSFGLLGWAGDRLLISDSADTSHILSVVSADDRFRLPLPPSQFWGASPDGRWLVRVEPDGSAFVRLRDGRLTSVAEPISLGHRLLGAGTWANDSSGIAAVALHRRDEPEIVLLSPERPEPRTLPHSSGAGGAPLWAGDDGSLVFPRDAAGRNGMLEALWCPTESGPPRTPPGGCRSLLSWREGVVLLRME